MVKPLNMLRILALIAALATLALACSLVGSTSSDDAGQPGVGSGGEPLAPTATQAPEPTAKPTATDVPPTPTVVHLVTPGSVPPDQYFLSDVSSGGGDEITRAKAGDNYGRNRLERPFASQTMDYRPYLDIGRVEISADNTWFYFTIYLYGPASDPANPLPGPYGIELDLDADGRGDLLVRGGPVPLGDWTTETVQVWTDANGDIGSTRPIESDAPQTGLDGYETLVFDQGQGADPDAAWVRPAVIEDTGVQFAIKQSATRDASFLWGAWADEGVNQPGQIDYNDWYTSVDAGELDTGLAAVAAVDNTCRMYFGFTPTGVEPGLCSVTGTVRNCSPHPMRMEPGAKMLTPFFDSGAILTNVTIGTYRFYDESTGGTLVLTATLSPGGTITITKTGLGDTYACQ